MLRVLIFTFFIFTFLYLFSSAYALNARSINSIEVEIIKSGFLYFNKINEAELTLYIPQKGIKTIQIYPDSWKFANDSLGNKVVKIFWKNPSSVEKYEVKIKVKNFAKYFENLEEENWDFSELAKKETNLTKSNEEMKKLAYGKETLIEKIVRLNIWLHNNIRYEINKEETKSAEETFLSKRGACGEFSNLLIALLRSQNIPARFVAGYAFSEEKNDFLPHSWVEVLINNKWVPFDPTWFEGFYLDASHIKFANLLDSNFKEELVYKGLGNVKWEKNPISFKIINYTTLTPKIKLEISEKAKAGYNLLANVSLEGNCQFLIIKLSSCVDKNKKPVFIIYEKERKLWFCGKQNVYWLVSLPKEKTNYICSLTVFEQSGAKDKIDVLVKGKEELKDVLLAGPETVEIGENFILKSEKIGLFFSPNFTQTSYSKKWNISLNRTGNYKFYFYSENQKGEKIVKVLSKKDLKLVEIEKPENISEGKKFLLNLTIENLLNKTNSAKIIVNFLNQSFSKEISFLPNEKKKIRFELMANKTGEQKISIQIEGKELLLYSTSIKIKKLNILEKILIFFQEIFEKIKSFFYFLRT